MDGKLDVDETWKVNSRTKNGISYIFNVEMSREKKNFRFALRKAVGLFVQLRRGCEYTGKCAAGLFRGGEQVNNNSHKERKLEREKERKKE